MTSIRVIGPGRAGRSLAVALADVGFDMRALLGRGDDLTDAAVGVDMVVIATPDAAVADVAAAIAPVPATLIVHVSGSLGLDVLAPHGRRASLHPLVPLPTPEVGRVRLASGIAFAVAGDSAVSELVSALGGMSFVVGDDQRAAYHAAACVAANHVVALMGQVQRIASATGLGLDPFVGLARAALDDVSALGPAAALTGPAARGDEATLARHRRVLPSAELDGYDAGVALAARLADAVPAPSSGPVVITTAAGFSAALDAHRWAGRRVGLVPTMGALHAGHGALIERAASECDVVAVTIFVNPLQFNNAADLAAYPRHLDRDVEVAGRAGATMVFAPAVDEMYPNFPEPQMSSVHVVGVSDSLEGAARPGHFDGVATVVTKLFALAGRCRAYFGEKDFQQLAVVRRLSADLSLPVDVVGCPTVRESDGLALSSRNVRLSADDRGAALALHRALLAGLDRLNNGERRTDAVRAAMAAELAREPAVVPDYVAVVDAATFAVPERLNGAVRLLVAATVGPVRLIDNEGAVVTPLSTRLTKRVRAPKVPAVTITKPIRTGVQ